MTAEPRPRKPRQRSTSRQGNAPQPADPTRDVAFDILCGVVENRRMLENSLTRSATAHNAPPRDRAAAHRLAATTLRHMGTLRALLEPFLRKEPPEPVRVALMMGCAQLLFLETPPHAAVGTTVSLLRRRKLAPFTGLANAVLRKVADQGATLLEGLDQNRLDIPAWLWTAWNQLGRGVPRAIARGISHEAPLDLTLRPGATAPEGGVVLPNGSIRMPSGTRVAELPGYEEGAFWVQDAAATLPARLLNAQPGEKVTDLCAAPGGKTAQLAAAGATVTAVEQNPNRLTRLRENMERLAYPVEIVQADATSWVPDTLQDAILLDAPCSATGTARRHPDVLWVKRPRDLNTLTAGQDQMLKAAMGMVKPGGRLIYAVCSLQEEEGPARARAALAMGWQPAPFTPEELAVLPEALTPEGWLRTHPGMWADKGSMDGFFAARFIRPKD